MILFEEILNLTTFLFFTGMIGVVLNRKNIIITMMSIELMLLAVNLNFLIFSQQFDDVVGQIFVLFILTIAAIESAIGLAILSLYNSTKNTITFDVLKNKNFNLIIRKRRELILIPQRISSTLTGVESLVHKMEESERNIVVLLSLVLFSFAFILFNIGFGVFWLTAIEQKIHNLLLICQELEELIKALLEAIKNIKPNPPRKTIFAPLFDIFFGPPGGGDSKSFFQTCFPVVAGVVVLGVCIYVGPAPFVAVKDGISAYLLSCCYFTDIFKYKTISPEGLSLDWWVRIQRHVCIDILVKPSDMAESVYAQDYIEMLHQSLKVAKLGPSNPLNQSSMANVIDIATTTITQAPPIL